MIKLEDLSRISKEKNRSIEDKLVEKLIRKGYTISFGESMTGGMLASTIVNVSGSSNVIKESYVTYCDEAKVKILGVNPKTIEANGVVSRDVVLEMARGLCKLTGANVCAAVSGYAEQENEKQGYAWYAVLINGNSNNAKEVANFVSITGDRNEVRRGVTNEILGNIFDLVED